MIKVLFNMEFHNFTWFVYTIRLVLYLQKKSSLGFVTRFDPALLKRRLGSETITRKKIIIEKTNKCEFFGNHIL